MHNLADMIWIEARKAIRSKMPLWTGLGSLVMPVVIAFLVFVARNPNLSQKLGLISAKANLFCSESLPIAKVGVRCRVPGFSCAKN